MIIIKKKNLNKNYIMNKNSYGIYGNKNYRKNSPFYIDKNSENILRENIKSIHSNINFVKKSDPEKYEKDSFDKLCQNTILIITETNELLFDIEIDNKSEILNFLNKSSQICKNALWYRQMKNYSTNIKNIDQRKNEILLSNNQLSNNVQNMNSNIELKLNLKKEI